jgi:hypothetical protein
MPANPKSLDHFRRGEPSDFGGKVNQFGFDFFRLGELPISQVATQGFATIDIRL